jgi:hypothetical protein
MAKKINFTGHTIICGWNFQGTRITNELLSANIKLDSFSGGRSQLPNLFLLPNP